RRRLGGAAEELVEHTLAILRRDTEPGVGHREHGATVALAHEDQYYAALWRVLDRMREQVSDHLGEAVAVAVDDQRVVRHVEHELVRLRVREEQSRLLARELDEVERR